MGRCGRARKQERRADHVLAIPLRTGQPPSLNGSFLTETKSSYNLSRIKQDSTLEAMQVKRHLNVST